MLSCLCFLPAKAPKICVDKIQPPATRKICVDKIKTPATRKVWVDKSYKIQIPATPIVCVDKKKRADHISQTDLPASFLHAILEQPINIDELKCALNESASWTSRDGGPETIERLIHEIHEGRDGLLSMKYTKATEEDGKLEARPRLQNCKRQIRSRALSGNGFSVDLKAAFSSILIGLVSEIRNPQRGSFRGNEGHENFVKSSGKDRKRDHQFSFLSPCK